MNLFLKLALSALVFSNFTFADCYEPSATDRYVIAPLTPEVPNSSGKIKIFYKLLNTFNPKKPTLLVINGGPGGNHGIIGMFAGTKLASEMNIVGFDHRGVGCTKSLEVWPVLLEPNEFGMSRAAADIDAIRKDLLGDQKWFVYGISYGTMLGQKYALAYQDKIEAIVLDSAFHDSKAIDIGRQQYVKLFFREIPAVSTLFDKFVTKFPDLKNHFLRAARPDTYTYSGRTYTIKNTLEKLLALSTKEEVVQHLEKLGDLKPPFVGMLRQIMCEELWDYPAPQEEANGYYWWMFNEECPHFKRVRNPMQLGEQLKTLKVRTFIWSGKFDPVTPYQAMREMKDLIPGALLWENPHAGHGLISEKSACAKELAMMFFNGKPNKEIEDKANSESCQSPPGSIDDAQTHYWDFTPLKTPLL